MSHAVFHDDDLDVALTPPAAAAARLSILGKIPPAVLVLLAADLLLGVLSLIKYEARLAFGYNRIYTLLSLGGEDNVGTWYSVVQLALVGVVLAVFAAVMQAEGRRGAVLLWLAPAMFLFLSMDEALQLHEWLGGRLVRALHISADNGKGTMFHKTGFWMVVLAPAFVAAAASVAWLTRTFWRGRTRVIALGGAGFAVFLFSSAGMEVLTNTASTMRFENLLVTMEETGEMLGITLIFWAALELMRSHGIALCTRDATHVGTPAPATPHE